MGILRRLSVSFELARESYRAARAMRDDPSKAFRLGRRHYFYFDHPYNVTGQNERSVEVPIIWSAVRQFEGRRILEVGNVLSHYYSFDHDIVDKYEKADGVINQDIVDYVPSGKYDLIVSISTIEHVGWDEETKDPAKISKALGHLKSLLKPGGKIVVTLPLGYNADMDRLINGGGIIFDEWRYMKRISQDNTWIETRRDDVREAKYGSPFPFANAVIIGTIRK